MDGAFEAVIWKESIFRCIPATSWSPAEAVRCRCKSVVVAIDLPSRIRSPQRLGFQVIGDGGVHKSWPLAGIPTMICLFTIS